jgi:hypothetical protein
MFGMTNAAPAVCAVGVPELPLPEVNVWPGNVITSFTAAPATSVSVPKFVDPAVTPVKTDVPDDVILPLASGAPVVGRTRTFCHINEFVTPLLLADVIEKVICVEVTALTATLVPLATPLIFLLPPPFPPILVIKTVGVVPPVSKMNPAGTFRMIVPTPALPLEDSLYVGPVRVVKPPPTLSAEMALPPVAGVTVPVPAALTVMVGLVFGVLAPFVISEAVSVWPPAVPNVTLYDCVPLTSAAFAGNVAVPSLDVMPTTSVELTRFQFASTALTVTANEPPTNWVDGVPVFPVDEPGTAVSPGTRSCSFVNGPALTVMDGLALSDFEPSVTSLAMTVSVPAVLSVMLNVRVPEASSALLGRMAFGSVAVMLTTSLTVLTKFQ